MFDHFTFGVHARSHQDVSSSSYSTYSDISPFDTAKASLSLSSRSPLSPPLSPRHPLQPCMSESSTSTIADLALQLDDLHPKNDDISASYLCSEEQPHPAAEPFEIDPRYQGLSDGDSPSPSSSSSSSPKRCRRLQRQLNTQMLCASATQRSALSALVEDMVASGSQCNVFPAPLPSAGTTSSSFSTSPPHSANSTIPHTSPPPCPLLLPALDLSQINTIEPDPLPSPSLDVDDLDDEGFCDAEDGDDEEHDPELMLMTLRRAACPSGVRKLFGGGMGSGMSVFQRPRMRKKIMRRKRVEGGEGVA